MDRVVHERAAQILARQQGVQLRRPTLQRRLLARQPIGFPQEVVDAHESILHGPHAPL
jgi:hypothetical protein